MPSRFVLARMARDRHERHRQALRDDTQKIHESVQEARVQRELYTPRPDSQVELHVNAPRTAGTAGAPTQRR